MAIPTSPAVVFLEKDNSAYPPNIDSSIVGIVGFASKGPTDTPVLITSQENLLRVFGNPSESLAGQGLEGALEILEATNQIRFVRAIPGDAKSASALVKFGVCPALKFAASSIGVTASAHFRVSVWDADGTQVLENQVYSVPTNIATVTQGQAFALASKFGDGSYQTDPLFVAYNDSTKTTGYLVCNFAGIGARMDVSAYSDFPLATLTSALQPVDLSAGADGALVSSVVSIRGLDIPASSLSYKVEALYAGDGYNLTTDTQTNQTLGNSIEVSPGGGAYSFITINNDGVAAETYKVSLIDDSTFVENVININVDNKISDYIQGNLSKGVTGTYLGAVTELESILTKITNLQSTEVTSVTLQDYNSAEVTGTPRFVKFVDATYNLVGGTNGTMTDGNLMNNDSTAASAIIGNAADRTGLYALDDDLLNISIAIIPGIPDQSVQSHLVTLAETSQNFLAVVSPPMGLDSVQEAVDWMNGKDGVRTAAINSSWASVFWPWVQVFDVFSAKDRWYDPAIFAARQMVFTDATAETWFAPAGFRRGRLTKPTAVELPLNQGDRDALYVNNINPIVNFAPEGITIFGQKTAQRLTTALDRINVRRLMIFLRKVLLQSGRADLFEPNDAFTWEAVKDKAEAVLGDIQARRGITAFKVICDETVNTPVRVDRNELWCKILLKPTKTAEWIIFEVNLTNQSAKFSG